MYSDRFIREKRKKNRRFVNPKPVFNNPFSWKLIFRTGTYILLLYICFILGEFLIFKTDYFRISGMKVQGAQDQERIREICYYSGILPRQLIFDLNLELAAEKIKLLPYIEDVEIKRDVSGVILIEPVFSKAGAIIKDGNEFVIVTESRKILKRTDILTDKELELPLITGFKTGRIQAGAILRQYRLKLAFEWLKGLPEEFRKNLSELSVRNSLDTIMVFKQGLAVRADTLKRFKEKKENLVYLISYFKKNNVPTEYIDIRFDIGYVVKKL